MPAAAQAPCPLYTLPPEPTQADLEIGYATRGAQVVGCDGARQLAVATHAAWETLIANMEAERARRLRPWWRFW